MRVDCNDDSATLAGVESKEVILLQRSAVAKNQNGGALCQNF